MADFCSAVDTLDWTRRHQPCLEHLRGLISEWRCNKLSFAQKTGQEWAIPLIRPDSERAVGGLGKHARKSGIELVGIESEHG